MKLTANAINYTLERLSKIAFPSVAVEIETSPNPQIIIDNSLTLTFNLMSKSDINLLLQGILPYKTENSADEKLKIPVFGLKDEENYFNIVENKVFINADFITISYVLLSRYEELLPSELDNYGRFKYENSLACKYKFIDIPLVDEYAMVLRKIITEKFPQIKIEPRIATILPTHDIDFLFRFKNMFIAAKSIFGGDLISRRSTKMMGDSLAQYKNSYRDKLQDPLIIAIWRLIEVSKAANLHSIFYFKGLQKGDLDYTYDVFSLYMKFCVNKILASNMGLGLHGSLYSFDDSQKYAMEKYNLTKISGIEVFQNRQHFLRFNVSKTLEVWQESGLKSDSTLGYAEREGFRCGTCHPYYLFDINRDCASTVLEHPLIVMDTTLYRYRNFNCKKAYEAIANLYSRCLAVEGDFVILWHNTTMFREYESWFNNVYLKFIKTYAKNSGINSNTLS